MNRQIASRALASFVLAAALAAGFLSSVPPAFGCGGSQAGSGCISTAPAASLPGLDAVEAVLRAIRLALP